MAEPWQEHVPVALAKSELRPEIVQRIADRIDEIYAKRAVLGEDDRPHDLGRTSVDRHRGQFIADLVLAQRPRATLEVGMAWGLSTLFILRALLENGSEFEPHVVIDPAQSVTYHNAALRSLRELGLRDMVEFIGERSEFALPQLARQKRKFDLAFIDGDHRFDYVLSDLRFVDLTLRPGGIAIFDDSNWDPVHLACRFAETNYDYQSVTDYRAKHRRERLFRMRYADRPLVRALRKPIPPVKRSPEHFVPFFDGFRSARADSGDSGELRHRGLMALAMGDRLAARQIFRLALSQDPTHLKTYFRLLRTYLPLRIAHALSANRPRPE